eukprot:SAG11_NODE_14831_length_598_cov_0.911824_2_plen_76_part_01
MKRQLGIQTASNACGNSLVVGVIPTQFPKASLFDVCSYCLVSCSHGWVLGLTCWPLRTNIFIHIVTILVYRNTMSI